MKLELFYHILFFGVILTNVNSKKNRKKDNVEFNGRDNFLYSKRQHKFKALPQRSVKAVVNSNDYNNFKNSYLSNILRVRVPGTVGHHEVKRFLISKLQEYKWNVSLDEFEEKTPLGKTKFTNIMATLNPNADRRLALVAHYDSKLVTPKDGRYFLAATDSAVPCAMLLDFAKILSEKYEKNKEALKDVSPMIILLDGEEAFVEWTKTDSIYGSRHLADLLSKTKHHNPKLSEFSTTALDSLDAFVLFDLIGTSTTQFIDIYPATSPLYQRLQQIEMSLRKSNLIASPRQYFKGQPYSPVYIEDDHVPFLEKGVPILHLISVPFPKEWHTLDDNEKCLDETTISNLLIIFKEFLLEYFHFE